MCRRGCRTCQRMRSGRSLKAASALVGVALAVGVAGTGCGSDREETGGPVVASASASSAVVRPARLPAPLLIEWTGGIDGRHIAVTVRPDGSWTRTTRRGSNSYGRLDGRTLATIARLATSDELRAEARRARWPRPTGQCADFVGVKLTMGDLVVDNRASFCGELELPTQSRLAALVGDASRAADSR